MDQEPQIGQAASPGRKASDRRAGKNLSRSGSVIFMAAFFLDAGFEHDPRFAEIYSQNHPSADSDNSSVEGGVELAALVRPARTAHNG